jgi:XTP/dITP diphosphohydrolase
MRITLASHNVGKVERIRALLSGLPIDLRGMTESGIDGEAEETGAMLHQNAYIKAAYAYDKLVYGKTHVISEDSGIFFHALNGAPGVLSARWAGKGVPAEVTMNYALEQMRGKTDRSATFVTVACVMDPFGQHRFFRGQVYGTITEEPRCQPKPQMPYAPIFVPDGETLSYAEMSLKHENSVSHRGLAFRQVRLHLETELAKRHSQSFT